MSTKRHTYPSERVKRALMDPALEHIAAGPARDLLLWIADMTESKFDEHFSLVVEVVERSGPRAR
jgi:hypothetical protein